MRCARHREPARKTRVSRVLRAQMTSGTSGKPCADFPFRADHLLSHLDARLDTAIASRSAVTGHRAILKAPAGNVCGDSMGRSQTHMELAIRLFDQPGEFALRGRSAKTVIAALLRGAAVHGPWLRQVARWVEELASDGWRYRGYTGRSEEHTSELQSRTLISYAVFCLKK